MYKYFRMNYSGYFSDTFAQKEKKELASVKGLISVKSPDDAEVIITSSDTVTEKIPTQAKLIIHPNSGYDRFNLEWLKNRDIPVIVGSPIRQIAVAEYYLSALFQHFSSIPTKTTWDEKRSWRRKLLKDQRVLIFGQGHIGTYLEEILKKISKSVLVIDPFKNLHKKQIDYKNFDVVISAFGLNKSTENFFNKDFFSHCSDDVLLLHASRGKQVDISSLTTFLKENKSSAAYIDVFPEEPFDLNSIKLPNLHCSCHVAGVYDNIEQNLIEFEKQVLLDYISLNKEEFLQKYKNQNLNERKDHPFLI
jgi:phosphoglycerate dehydrogenase-like enzyme